MNKAPVHVLLLTNNAYTSTHSILYESSTVPWNGETLIENNLKTLIFLLNQPHSCIQNSNI